MYHVQGLQGLLFLKGGWGNCGVGKGREMFRISVSTIVVNVFVRWCDVRSVCVVCYVYPVLCWCAPQLYTCFKILNIHLCYYIMLQVFINFL